MSAAGEEWLLFALLGAIAAAYTSIALVVWTDLEPRASQYQRRLSSVFGSGLAIRLLRASMPMSIWLWLMAFFLLVGFADRQSTFDVLLVPTLVVLLAVIATTMATAWPVFLIPPRFRN